ncbi:MAG: hypothetical protein JOS17DRAFT_796128 [Linnemannia elongata]|nr:MAG: hypothetical protein JOS17DRAFT_796128 [Linnemannia elongata]
MEITAYLILATAITTICLYIVDYSLWWALTSSSAGQERKTSPWKDPIENRFFTVILYISILLARYSKRFTHSTGHLVSLAFDTRRMLPSNLTSASLMAATERQLQPARNSTQLARNIPPPISAPVARQEIDVVEPEVIKDDYVTVVVKVLDRWTGQQSTVKPRQKYASSQLLAC